MEVRPYGMCQSHTFRYNSFCHLQEVLVFFATFTI